MAATDSASLLLYINSGPAIKLMAGPLLIVCPYR